MKKIVNDQLVDMSTEEIAERQFEIQSIIAELQSLEYKKLRQDAYPSIQEQLDMQYWDSVNGTTIWADAIAAVKAQYPKP